MVYQFFITQWNNPCKDDWTETVKQNMKEFAIQIDMEYIKSKSRKAWEYTLKILQEKQQKHS